MKRCAVPSVMCRIGTTCTLREARARATEHRAPARVSPCHPKITQHGARVPMPRHVLVDDAFESTGPSMNKPYCDVLRARARQIRRLSKWVNDSQARMNLTALANALVTDAKLLDSDSVRVAVNSMPRIAERFEFPDSGLSSRATTSQGSC
jgi:hypothetical protein